MKRRLFELPVVLTCFGYRPEYVAEMMGMLDSVREHHPAWPVMYGRGPAPGHDDETFEVDSPGGTSHWRLPVSLNLDGTTRDFYKIVMMKGCWMSRVWSNAAGLTGDVVRILWMDADTRLNGLLDIEVDPEAEVVAGPWWDEEEYFDGKGMIGSGLLLFQGTRGGPVESLLDEWSSECLSRIQAATQVPFSHECDDDVLTQVLHKRESVESDYLLLKLERRKYSGWMPAKGGKLLEKSLVDHWYISEKMESPDTSQRDWPPPEEYRRKADVGSRLPGWIPDWDPDDETPGGSQ